LTIILPLLPFYAEHFGALPTVVGMLISSYALCQLIAGPILGKLSDRMGRKPLLIVSQLGTLVGFLILAFATSLWMVFVSRIIDGLTAGNLSLAQAQISDVTEPEKRARAFGIIGIAFGIGFMIGPGITGLLTHFGNQYPIFAAAFLSASSVVCTATLLQKVKPHPDDADSGPGGKRLGIFEWAAYGQYFARPELGRLLRQFFFFAFSFAMLMSGFALFAERRFHYGAKEVSYVFLWVGFLGVILQGSLMKPLVKMLGERKLVWTGFAGNMVGFGLLAWSRALPGLLTATTVSSYGNGVLRPSVTALITHQAGRREQGVVLGLTQSLTSISQIIAPLIAGAMIQRGWLSTWALGVAAVCFFGLLSSLPKRA
jgi:multidrug resistance protein